MALAKFWLVLVWFSMRRCPCGLSLGLKSKSPPPIAVAAVLSAREGAGVARPPSEPIERPPLKILESVVRSGRPLKFYKSGSAAPTGAPLRAPGGHTPFF